MNELEIMDLFVKEYVGYDTEVIEAWKKVKALGAENLKYRNLFRKAARWDELNFGEHGRNPYLADKGECEIKVLQDRINELEAKLKKVESIAKYISNYSEDPVCGTEILEILADKGE